jgi:hypothetical protein
VFAHKYGQLHSEVTRFPTHPDSVGVGALETLRMWKISISIVRDIIGVCELSRTNPREAFRRFAKQDIRLWGVELFISVKSRNSPATVDVRAPNLAAAIQLQAVAAILEGRKSAQCIECGTWFQIGAGARRSQSKFCSTRCKDTYHNRLKAQARRTDHA